MLRTVEIKGARPATVDPGVAPMLQWLKIADLVIDDDYQRDLKRGNWNAIRRIADRFKWSRFSPVFVAPVEGGKYAIIDGQHRTHAAAICGFAEVPCQIVQMSIAEQAASFAAVNGLVTKVTGGQIYKAALTANEPWAVDCCAAVSAAGCKLMIHNKTTRDKLPGEVFALALIKQHVKAGNSAAITFALDALRRSEGGKIADYWSGPVLKILLEAVATRPALLDRSVDLAAFLDDFDVWRALDEAEETTKKKRRMGFTKVTRYDIAAGLIGDALDDRFAKIFNLKEAEAA